MVLVINLDFKWRAWCGNGFRVRLMWWSIWGLIIVGDVWGMADWLGILVLMAVG